MIGAPVPGVRQLARVADRVDVLFDDLERLLRVLGARRVRGHEEVKLLARALVAVVRAD